MCLDTMSVKNNVNYGDAIESVFAIFLSLLMANKTITEDHIRKIMRRIVFNETINIADNISFRKSSLLVNLTTFLKSESLLLLFDSSELPTSLLVKINGLIENFQKTQTYKELIAHRDHFVDSHSTTPIVVSVIAAGSKNAQNKSAKSDITIVFNANNYEEHINISLKSESKTISNLSPTASLVSFSDLFNLSTQFKKQAAILHDNYSKRKLTYDEKKHEISDIFLSFIDNIEAIDVSSSATIQHSVIDMISKQLFGDDCDYLIDIRNTGEIYEITRKQFDYFKSSEFNLLCKKSIRTELPTLQFFLLNKEISSKYLTLKDMFFQFRIKIRKTSDGSSECKFYVELGNLLFENSTII